MTQKVLEKSVGTGPKNIGSGLGFASRIGSELVISVLIGTYGGYLLDDYLGSSPWLMLLGLIFGGAAGFLNIYRAFQELNNNNSGEDRSDKNGF